MSRKSLLIALIVVGVVAGLVSSLHRLAVEDRNRRVETVVDYPDALGLALADGQPLDQTLDTLRAAGITSLALWEDPLDNLRLNGAMAVQAITPKLTRLTFSPNFPGQQQRVTESLTNKTRVTFTSTANTVMVNAPYSEISLLGVGLDPTQIDIAVRHRFYICPRLYNYAGVNPAAISWMLNTVKQQCRNRATVLIFLGPDVLGNRAQLNATAQGLEDTGLKYGSVEFGKQIGDEDLSESAADRTVRVHSIGGNEMPTMDEPTAVGRYVLGTRERNIRVAYIRLFLTSYTGEPDILVANVKYIGEVVRGLHDGGLSIGPAHPFRQDPKPGIALRLLLALGVAGGVILLKSRFIGINDRIYVPIFVAIMVLCVALAIPSHTELGREGLALLAAISFPSIGMLTLSLPRPDQPPASRWKAVELALRRYEWATMWTVAGIVMVVGLLADRLFMLKVYEFAGIRIAVILPILVTLLYYGLGLGDMDDRAVWRDRKARMVQRWSEFQVSPMLIGQVLLGMVALAIIIVIVLRSGNDPGVGVSSTELSFRSLLNKILFVRPRTKELLFAHPILVMGLAFAFAGKRKWLLLFLIVGAIGQSSLLNTFCHIHTPLIISLLRGGIGWTLGAIIGIVLYALLTRREATEETIKSVEAQ